MKDVFAGFDWDKGNRSKCQKHGVSRAEIEGLFTRPVMILPDAAHSQTEERLRAIGHTRRGRAVFVVFTIRERGGKKYIRPVSTRYMHREEIEHYAKENSDL
jgi:uncharacterized DUF497 family protein